MKKILLLFFTYAIIWTVHAQVYQDARMEFNLVNDGYSKEQVIPFGKNGVVIFSQKTRVSSKDKSQTEWKIELFDTSLKPVKKEDIVLEDIYDLDEVYHTDQNLYLLFTTRKGAFSIASIDIPALSYTITSGETPKKSNIRNMVVMGNHAFFNASAKSSPCVMLLDFKTGKQEYIPISIKQASLKDTYIRGLKVFENTQKVCIYLTVYTDKEVGGTYIIEMNNKGEQDSMVQLTKNIGQYNNIITITASEIDGNRRLFTGTYAQKDYYISEGIFFAQSEGETITSINFYNFLDLENFLSYLPEAQQERIKERNERQKEKGKELNRRYRLTIHPIIESNEGYLFLGEVYAPVETRESAASVSSTFEGYSYSHAILAKFNKDGKLAWDQTFEIKLGYNTQIVKRFVSITEADDKIKLTCSGRSNLYSQIFDVDGNIVSEFKSDRIDTIQEGDKSILTEAETFFWYDNFFITYGTQKIKNKENDQADRKKIVYFINKIRLE